MRKFLIVLATTVAMAFGATTLASAGPPANSNACPPKSPAMGGSPSCGKPKPGNPPACTLGAITSAVDAIDFGPLDSTVHDVLCALAANGITI